MSDDELRRLRQTEAQLIARRGELRKRIERFLVESGWDREGMARLDADLDHLEAELAAVRREMQRLERGRGETA